MASRRNFLTRIALAAAFGAPLFAGRAKTARGDGCAPIEPDAALDRPLKAIARDRGLLFGAAADRNPLAHDRRYANALIRECAMVTPENSMKWERLRPSPDGFDFANADWLVEFAEANGLQAHGHALTWHRQLPDWFDAVVDESNAERLLADHIATVAGRYAGKLRSWDVVNEAIADEHGRGDGLRLTPWLKYLGTGYVELAFRLAAEADPGALLVYNDYGLEYDDGYFETRRSHVLDLLAGLLARGAPVHALGVQSHLEGGRASSFKAFARFLDEIAALGLDVMITELDVSDENLPSDPAARDCLVAETYRAYLDVVLANPKVRSIAVWGLSDRYSWLSEFAPRDDGRPVRPLPFDHEMRPKPARRAIAEALRA